MRSRTLLFPLTLTLAAACGGGSSQDPAIAEQPGDGVPGDVAGDQPVAENPSPETAVAAPVAPQDAIKKQVADRDAAWRAKDAKKVSAGYAPGAVIATPGARGLEETTPAEMEKRMSGY